MSERTTLRGARRGAGRGQRGRGDRRRDDGADARAARAQRARAGGDGQLPLHHHRRPRRRVPGRRRAQPRARLGAAALLPRDPRPRLDAAGDPGDGPLLRAVGHARRTSTSARRRSCAPTSTPPSSGSRRRQWADDRHLRREARPHAGLPGRRADRAGARRRSPPAASPSSPRTSRRSRRTRRWSRRSPRAAGAMNRYPDPDATLLRRRIAERYETEPGRIAVGNGSCEILLAAAEALCEPGAEILYAWPSFSMYPYLAALTGAREIRVPLAEGDVHDLDAMAAEVTAATQLLIVCNPNNPTGDPPPGRRDRRLLRARPRPRHRDPRRGLRRVPDRTTTPTRRSTCSADFPNLVVLRTFSKCYGLAGLRVGYALGSAEFRAAVDAVRQPFSVNALAQAAGGRGDPAPGRRRRPGREHPRRAGPRRGGRSRARASTTPRRQANFSWVDLGDADEAEVVAGLAERGDRRPPRHAARRPRPHPRHLRHPRRERPLPRRARRAPGLNRRSSAVAVLQTRAVKRTGDTTSSLRAAGAALALPASPITGDLARRPASRRRAAPTSALRPGAAPSRVIRARSRAVTGPEVGFQSFGGW